MYAVAAAIDLAADVIITVTETGLTSRLIVKYRPPIPVVAITSWRHTCAHLAVTRGTIPIVSRTPFLRKHIPFLRKHIPFLRKHIPFLRKQYPSSANTYPSSANT